MQTSISDIQNFKRCRRRWNYASSAQRNLIKVGMSKPALELGSLVHAALAEWTLDVESDLEVLFLKLSANRLNDIKKQYRDIVGMLPSEEELNPMYDSIKLGHSMMVNYRDYWKSPIPPSMKFALPEQDILVEIPGTEHTCTACGGSGLKESILVGGTLVSDRGSCDICNGRGLVRHRLRAIIDGLLENKSGVHFILERKTYSSRPTEDSLKMTDQFIGYCWVAQQLGIQDLYGIAYDGMWKRAKPPKNTTMPDLFLRLPIRFSQDEIDEWGEQLRDIVMEMSNPDLPLYMNRRWEGCNDCAFDKLCLAQSRGEDVEFLIKNMYSVREAH